MNSFTSFFAPTPRMRQRAILPFLATVLLLPAATVAQSEAEERVEKARVVLEKWVDTRRLIAKEKRDWEVGKEMLEDRIEVLTREIAALRKLTTEAKSNIAEADKKKAELVEKSELLKSASSGLAAAVGGLEKKTVGLIERLPEVLVDRVRKVSQAIPTKEEDATKMALGLRFQNVIGVLNEIDRFNREISTASEQRTLDSGLTVAVTALYLGIGQAYYVTPKGDAAGIGTASDKGWVWVAANEAAGEIAKAIAILKSEEAANFVRLPIRIR